MRNAEGKRQDEQLVFSFRPLSALFVWSSFLCLLAPLAGAEEAWRSDGRRLRGTLALNDGELRFQPSEGAAVAPADLTRIRFTDGTPPPFRAGCGRRVRLWDGERITGQIFDVNKNTVRLRTAWAARLELPRAAVAAIEPLPGWRTVFAAAPPDTPVAGLRTAGEPALVDAEDGTAGRAFLLRTAGQRLTCTLRSHEERGNEEMMAGRVGVNFQERGPVRGARWTVELLFQEGKRSRRLIVTVAGDGDHYQVDSEGLSGTARRVKQTPGWHRLLVQFSKGSLRLTCDDEVLWYNLDEGPGAALHRVTIACYPSTKSAPVRGAVAWNEFCIERAVEEHLPPPADAEQDSIRLLDDDQLFGHILQADRRGIQIKGRFGKRSLPWTVVSGCSFRRPAAPADANKGAKVRLFVHSGLCAEPDVVEGVVTALDERRLVLRHALLGERTFERSRLRELRLLPHGSK